MQDNSYNEVPYLSLPFWQTHPEYLHTVGKLFGMAPPDFRIARVLELGCAGGGNVLPLAATYPAATFTGIDLSSVQIAEARATAALHGLTNVRLEAMSLLDIGAGFGEFDYIICHGLLSWVPKPVQDGIFEVCSRHLAANGIAYVSYNALPGWNMVRSIREMMFYHCARFDTVAEKVAQARALLAFIREGASTGAYAEAVGAELDLLAQQPDSYVAHDHLGETNEPLYFHEVAALAQANGLQYLGETELNTMFAGNHKPEVANVLMSAGDDIVRVEQYMDFLSNRRFRETLFCKADIALNRHLAFDCVAPFYIQSLLTTAGTQPITFERDEPVVFSSPTGANFTAHDRVSAALQVTLIENQAKPLALADLVARVARRLGLTDAAAIRAKFLGDATRLLFAGALRLHSDPGAHVITISEQPLACAYARRQAAEAGSNQVVNARHCLVRLDPVSRVVLTYLDGTNDIAATAAKVTTHFLSGELVAKLGDVQMTDAAAIEAALTGGMPDLLRSFAANALLVG